MDWPSAGVVHCAFQVSTSSDWPLNIHLQSDVSEQKEGKRWMESRMKSMVPCRTSTPRSCFRVRFLIRPQLHRRFPRAHSMYRPTCESAIHIAEWTYSVSACQHLTCCNSLWSRIYFLMQRRKFSAWWSLKMIRLKYPNLLTNRYVSKTMNERVTQIRTFSDLIISYEHVFYAEACLRHFLLLHVTFHCRFHFMAFPRTSPRVGRPVLSSGTRLRRSQPWICIIS